MRISKCTGTEATSGLRARSPLPSGSSMWQYSTAAAECARSAKSDGMRLKVGLETVGCQSGLETSEILAK